MNLRMESFMKYIRFEKSGVCHVNSVDHYNATEFNGVKVYYDEYLDIQRFGGNDRGWFAVCFYDGGGGADCKGQIVSINLKSDVILFKRIYVSGIYGDGTWFEGKEDHVWMSRKGFENYKVGDCLSFYAEVYKYLKTGNGKTLDYSIRNPRGIEKIEAYDLPTDEELLRQEIGELVCETCMYTEHCYRDHCIAAPGWRKDKIQQLIVSRVKL